ncbi:adaptin ear-binding coat-associated protein 1 NECAP-1 [Testicularia cyperi]|uniref:Adaptin ear-binding coat-associated protein 1 NECAP-1 n=1 Tax=Testicularia cyperi TaxID=1882483 RepID=A0A317XUA2_9BASI|nr:adaptin ear-binding coat-associated protein 1 NECAP-1 [Testicularia cyperi]
MGDYETVLFVARECFVYRVPPRTSTAGYKAAEWGDMEAFLWKGRLRIMESSASSGATESSRCSVRLEDSDTGDLFAECPYDVSGSSVEPVLDSSRYFVLRVESKNPSNAAEVKKAYIGMGFQDRSDSFDFNVALQDWTKRQKSLQRSKDAASSSPGGGAAGAADGDQLGSGKSPHLPEAPKDFSLKEGQTFAIKLPSSSSSGTRKSNLTANANTNSQPSGASPFSGLGAFLPPPPSKRK